MANDVGFLAELGLKIQASFGGLAGGIVGAWADEQATLKMWGIYAGAGLLTGNFMAAPALPVFQTIPIMGPLISEGGSGFLIGTCALIAVRTVRRLANNWKPNLPFGGEKQP